MPEEDEFCYFEEIIYEWSPWLYGALCIMFGAGIITIPWWVPLLMG